MFKIKLQTIINGYSINHKDPDTIIRFKSIKEGDILKLKPVDYLLENSNNIICGFIPEMKTCYNRNKDFLDNVPFLIDNPIDKHLCYWINSDCVMSFCGFLWSLDMFEYANDKLVELI